MVEVLGPNWVGLCSSGLEKERTKRREETKERKDDGKERRKREERENGF